MTKRATAAHGVARRRSPLLSRVPGSAVLIAALVFAGASVMLYPSAASWLSQVHQSELIGEYAQAVEHLGPEGRAEAIAAAHAYNSTLVGGTVLDPFTQAPASEAAAEYRSLLSIGSDDVMARLRIPSIDVDLPIFHGTSASVLDRGIGHLLGTALPVGGENTHAVLTGHRGLAESTMLTELDRVKPGDTFEIEVYGENLTYRVTESIVVVPSDTETLRPVAGRDLVTLVTCTPIGINSHRILVTGERIPTPDAEPNAAESGSPQPQWWSAGLGLAAVIAAGAMSSGAIRRRAEVGAEVGAEASAEQGTSTEQPHEQPHRVTAAS